MRSLIATTAIAAAALLTVPAPSAEAGGLFYRDRAPAYYAPPAQRHYHLHARKWCLFDWFRFDRAKWRHW